MSKLMPQPEQDKLDAMLDSRDAPGVRPQTSETGRLIAIVGASVSATTALPPQ
jgi:hypothetical protein